MRPAAWSGNRGSVCPARAGRVAPAGSRLCRDSQRRRPATSGWAPTSGDVSHRRRAFDSWRPGRQRRSHSSSSAASSAHWAPRPCLRQSSCDCRETLELREPLEATEVLEVPSLQSEVLKARPPTARVFACPAVAPAATCGEASAGRAPGPCLCPSSVGTASLLSAVVRLQQPRLRLRLERSNSNSKKKRQAFLFRAFYFLLKSLCRGGVPSSHPSLGLSVSFIFLFSRESRPKAKRK